jgi:Flp pilus assembly protein TadG
MEKLQMTKIAHMKRRGQRGAAIFGFLVIALLAFMGLAVVAIDFGHLGFSANEVQVVADTAALAGARALLENHNAMAQVQNPVTVAQTVVSQNQLDGGAATIAAGNVEVGTYDFNANTFTVGGINPNAVRATGEATVSNMVAGFFGADTSDVNRQAIAAYSGNGSAAPPCPISIGICNFNAYKTSGNCSDLPKITQVPSTTDNSGWTSLFESSANSATYVKYLPAACGGGGEAAPYVHVGQSIALSNGQNNSVLKTMEDCFKAGLLTECTVPLVNKNCNGQFNGSSQVVGFATFKIKSITTTGSNKGISMDGICESDEPGGPGGSDYGTMTVSMVH